jgi:hypothetical protein
MPGLSLDRDVGYSEFFHDFLLRDFLQSLKGDAETLRTLSGDGFHQSTFQFISCPTI